MNNASFFSQHEQNSAHLVYELAHTAYTQGEYEKATSYFRFLILLNNHSYANWLGLGASLLMEGQNEQDKKKQYAFLEDAIQAAKMAFAINSQDAKALLIQLEAYRVQNRSHTEEVKRLIEQAEPLVLQNDLLQKELERIKMKTNAKTTTVFDLLHLEKK